MLSCSVLYVCKSAERDKLQLLRPLQVCRETETAASTTASQRNCSYYDRFRCAERETAASTTASAVQRERICSYYV